MRDAADLDAGAVVLQAILQLLLDRAVVALLLHVDEVDDDQAGKVAQPELAGDFFGRLEVGLERGVLDRVLAGRAAGVDVDRDQRLGLVDDDVAARLQRHLRLQTSVELRLDAGAREDRVDVAVGLNDLGVARHQHAHEVFGFAVAVLAGDDDLVDVLVVEVADRALDQACLPRRRGPGAVDCSVRSRTFSQSRIRYSKSRLISALVRLAPAVRRMTPMPSRHVEILRDLLEPLAVLRRW